ncbi:uncharacterized protein LOC134269932 [Saccostrea cucullata]|uniref:uncharacterized protein LOC134269932 n=1 Tax=Saccostrea cuccullata TaxID=36930 RepID=UPI002ED0EFCE
MFFGFGTCGRGLGMGKCVVFLSVVENLAIRKSVTVSSRYNNGYFEPSKAVDGDKSAYLLDCALTASGQKEAWLTVDLGDNKNIASISILHGGFGLGAFSLRTSDSGLFPDSNGDGEVFAASPLRKICLDSFDEKDAQAVCLAWGFIPDSTLFYKSKNTASAPFYESVLNCAGNEVSINACPKGSRGCPSGSQVAVKCKKGSTLSGFSVYVSDTEDWRSGTLCYQHDKQQIQPTEVSIDCVTYGRYVTVYNARNLTSFPNVSEFSYINICEIEVKGCDLGFYGENCTRCPQNCLNNTCHSQIGECFECIDGYTGQYCGTECQAGKYGKACSVQCGQCIDDKQCNHVNGSCPGECSPGWRGDKCDQKCDQSFYGRQCNMTCSEFCRGRLCDPTTGQCNNCVDGRLGFFCESEVAVAVDNSCAYADGNTWDTPPLIAVGLLSVAVILLIAILLVCFLKKKHQSSKPNKNNPNYQLAISRKDNNEYTGIHAAKSAEYTDVETSHYMEIGNSKIKTKTDRLPLNSQQYENLAIRKSVRVSSRYNNGYFEPSKAVDGDKSAYMLDCALTASGQKEAWLTVDLGEKKNIASIAILHGSFGLGAFSLRTSDSGLFPDSTGDGQVFAANRLRKICYDSFEEKDAQVVCLAWGFLP